MPPLIKTKGTALMANSFNEFDELNMLVLKAIQPSLKDLKSLLVQINPRVKTLTKMMPTIQTIVEIIPTITKKIGKKTITAAKTVPIIVRTKNNLDKAFKAFPPKVSSISSSSTGVTAKVVGLFSPSSTSSSYS